MASNQTNCRQILNRSRSDDDIEINLTPKIKKPRQTHSLPITPQKQLNKSLLEDPLTPTANLKMLVSAAFGMVSEQNEGTQKRELFNDDDFQEDSCSTVSDSVEDKDKIECSQESVDDKKFFDLGSGRKMKSLGLLCQKFLSKYPEGAEGTIINLHEVAKELNVERRRIYDIVNVLESLEYVTKKGKNTYVWHGSQRLVPILSKLKALANKIYGSDATDSNDELFFETDNNSKFNVTIPSLWLRNGILFGNQEVESSDLNNNTSSKQDDEANKRRNKSLGIFCQKLIMLFMVSKDQTIALEDAAREVIEVSGDPLHQNKTKVRRLYDIANILTSMDLIQKTVTYAGSRKAAFKWVGVDLDDIIPDTETLEITLNGGDKDVSIKTKQSLLNYPPTKHSLFRQTAEKIEGSKQGMSSVRKLESRSMSANNIVLQKKNKMPRTKSAAAISRKRSSTDIVQGEREENSSKEVRKEIKAKPKKDGKKDEVTVSQEKRGEESKLVTTPKKTQEFNHDSISPDERCFREEIKKLQERFPNKLQNTDGLLNLLNAHDELHRSSEEGRELRDTGMEEKGSRRCLLERLKAERQSGGEDLRGVKGTSVVEMCTQLGSRESSNGVKEESQKGLSVSCLETIIDQVKEGKPVTLRDEIKKVVGIRNMSQDQERIASSRNNLSGYSAEVIPSWQRYSYHVTPNVQKTSVGVQTSDTSPLKPSTSMRIRQNTSEVSSVASQTDLSDQMTDSRVIKSPGRNVMTNSPVSSSDSEVAATSSLANQASEKTPAKSPSSYFLVGLKQRSPNSPNRSFISGAITSLKSCDVTPVELANTMSAINNSNILKPSRLDSVPAIPNRDGVIKMVPIPPTPFSLPSTQAEKENYQRFLTPAVTPGKTSSQLTMQGARILVPFNLFNSGAEKLSPPPAQIPKVMPGLEETPMRDDIQDMLTKRSQRNISLLSSKDS